ncbi:hypothetical protein TIFTF001_019092 [Ficus carica]|uniref:Uncharacterized protein n=1 Tax=Ficus carica TaxID=3494 RepID=A0AA88ACD7_FICCA|nr:hypothetical protein TIFTF001_019092 [Ficus carica]
MGCLQWGKVLGGVDPLVSSTTWLKIATSGLPFLLGWISPEKKKPSS